MPHPFCVLSPLRFLRLIMVAGCVLLLATRASAQPPPELAEAEQMIRVGDHHNALRIASELNDRYMRKGDAINSAEGMRVVRLLALAKIDKEPKAALALSKRLLDNAVANLGPENLETYYIRMAYADALIANGDAKASREIWLKASLELKAREAEVEPFYLADCLYGRARSLMDPYELVPSFAGSPAAAIAPQVTFKEVYTESTREGLKLMTLAAEHYAALGPKGEAISAAVRKRKAEMKKEADDFFFNKKVELINTLIGNLYDREKAKTAEALELWKTRNHSLMSLTCGFRGGMFHSNPNCFDLSCRKIMRVTSWEVRTWQLYRCPRCTTGNAISPPDSVTKFVINEISYDVRESSRPAQWTPSTRFPSDVESAFND